MSSDQSKNQPRSQSKERRLTLALLVLTALAAGSCLFALTFWNRESPQDNGISELGLKTHKVELNQATWEEIALLPEIGPERARDIVEYRDKNGPYLTVAELTNVPGIGPFILSQIEDHLRCSLPSSESAPVPQPRKSTEDGIPNPSRP